MHMHYQLIQYLTGVRQTVFVILMANIFKIQTRNIVFVQHQFYRGDKRIKQEKIYILLYSNISRDKER